MKKPIAQTTRRLAHKAYLSTSDPRFVRVALLGLALFSLIFWLIGLALWQITDHVWAFVRLAYLGTMLGVSLGVWVSVPRRKRAKARRWVALGLGSFLFFYIALMGVGDIEIEGFFFALVSGVYTNAFYHYLLAKLIGPLLFGRIWCGWACWTVALLDWLPYRRNKGRLAPRWGWLRYLHFGLSLALVALLWFGFNYGQGLSKDSFTWLGWFLAGNFLYYAAGIGLALVLEDNRAFCKYLCPNTVLFKASSRFSLLKVKGDLDRCDNCGICSKACPMDIRVADFVQNKQRVLSTECILCQHCISACPHEALNLSLGFDLGNKEWLRQRPPSPKT